MRLITRVLCCLAAVLLLPLFGAGIAAAAGTSPHQLAATTLHYDASGAKDYQAEIEAAVKNWNGDVRNVQLAAAQQGQAADFTITEDDGWPRTYPGEKVGTGKVVIGKQAVDQGYDKTRIAAHEIGHILGLPDNRDGQCSTLMSGHSAPTSCTVAHPNQAERAQVEQNFAGGAAIARQARTGAYADCFAETVRS
ncbi:snapalysin family zinc-dependent metalloprotease [Sciscionella sediminilitoris]|uniref:snapalysin family zinc-dependent metalloprotease n=1 Tax=Sciscionella sediminilitoris TaxID=1445613 RepID=UPI0007C8418A|nr:snapalysin family zinc-dependent metalloprotease [Sciscionella sp. SE31]